MWYLKLRNNLYKGFFLDNLGGSKKGRFEGNDMRFPLFNQTLKCNLSQKQKQFQQIR